MRHTVVTPPRELVARGPLIDVVLSVHSAAGQQLLSQGKPIPTHVAKLMLDTGAQSTVVENCIPQQLGLTPIRFTELVGVSHKPEKCPVYMMSVSFLATKGTHKQWLTFSSQIIGTGSPTKPTDHKGLLGRDFLGALHVSYDGVSGTVEVIPSPQLLELVTKAGPAPVVQQLAAHGPAQAPMSPKLADGVGSGVGPISPFKNDVLDPAALRPLRILPKIGANAPCHCGSGKKYKKCHRDADNAS